MPSLSYMRLPTLSGQGVGWLVSAPLLFPSLRLLMSKNMSPVYGRGQVPREREGNEKFLCGAWELAVVVGKSINHSVISSIPRYVWGCGKVQVDEISKANTGFTY